MVKFKKVIKYLSRSKTLSLILVFDTKNRLILKSTLRLMKVKKGGRENGKVRLVLIIKSCTSKKA